MSNIATPQTKASEITKVSSESARDTANKLEVFEEGSIIDLELNTAQVGTKKADLREKQLHSSSRSPSDSKSFFVEEEEEEEEVGKQDEEQRIYYLSDTEYELDELESNTSMLASLFDWNYPIFELHDRYGDSILSKLSYRIFFDSGFFDCK